MGLFDRFRRREQKTADDPVFGALAFDGAETWQGDAFFEPAGDDVGLDIVTGGPEPGEGERKAYRDLLSRYKELLPAVAKGLLGLHAGSAELRGREGNPAPRSAGEMLALVQLNWIEIRRDGTLRLGYGFRLDAGPEGTTFTVLLKEGAPSGEKVEVVDPDDEDDEDDD